MTFEGQGNQATDFQIWAYNAAGDSWAQVGASISLGADTDGTITRSITTNCAEYVGSGGLITWGAYQTDNSDLIRIDFMETVVYSIIPPTTFTMEYDTMAAPSSVQPPAIGGGPTPFDISLTGFSAGDWAFVSFPDTGVSGNIETILDDSVLGDSGTLWDVAKWYDPQDTADPWKTYRSGASTNDLVTIDNTMGVWIHLTQNNGDDVLTISVDGAYAGGNVNINLYTGWNMVSFPSATPSTALPGVADNMAYYNGGATYLVTDAAPGSVLMTEGNAYWIHVTSDVVWSVPA